MEGGFYFFDGNDGLFAGFAFPTERHHPPHREVRRTPPPRETPYIRLQAEQSATADDHDPLIQSRDVGPSRIVVATTAVGAERPAPLVVWLMCRVTGPEEQRSTVIRYQVSTILSLAGLISALVLTLGQRQRIKKEQEAREALHEELRRSEHLASLGLMLAQVAHEVRNPLAGIRSTAQLWQRLPDMSHRPESIQAMIGAVDRLDHLLTGLLNFSKSEMSDRALIDLNQMFDETASLIRAQAVEQGVQIELQLAPNVPQIWGSSSGIRQVLLNSCNNSLQSMPHGGRLLCRTEVLPDRKAIQIEVEDSGTGIDPSLRSRLFEPFFTTRDQGTGLGLALCREILLKHGGTIELHDSKPHGTICRMIIPISLPQSGAIASKVE